jgi:hypothetical protein
LFVLFLLILVRRILRKIVAAYVPFFFFFFFLPFFCETVPIGSTKVLRDEHKCTAAGSGEIKQRPNEDTEKNEHPRLLQIGRKDTRKDDQRLKQVTRCNLGYGELRTLNVF